MENPVTVAISKLMEAKTNEWSYENFKKGCGASGADTIPGWCKAVPSLQMKLQNNEKFFEEVYE